MHTLSGGNDELNTYNICQKTLENLNMVRNYSDQEGQRPGNIRPVLGATFSLSAFAVSRGED